MQNMEMEILQTVPPDAFLEAHKQWKNRANIGREGEKNKWEINKRREAERK